MKDENPCKTFPTVVGLVHTPDTVTEFETYLQKFTGSEAAVAMTCGFMGWNLAAAISQRRAAEVKEFLAKFVTDAYEGDSDRVQLHALENFIETL